MMPTLTWCFFVCLNYFNAIVEMMHKNHPFRIFWLSGLLTLILAGIVGWIDGLAGLWIFSILVVLEVTLSFDNAVINSRVLAYMSPFWQKMFLTVGIFIAVFVVRFLLPIVIVAIATSLSFMEVVDQAFNHPDAYSAHLNDAAPMIEAFGGAFLLMIGLHYFIDRTKKVYWLKRIEKPLSAAGKISGLHIILMLAVSVILYLTVDPTYRETVLIASVLGIILHVGLGAMSAIFEKHTEDDLAAADKSKNRRQQVGMAAFASFMYLEFLDASFSLDGVIGAFAITTSVLLIITGLGAGAVWVRSLTIYLLRTGTLMKYRYLEHGAHWAITALGFMMFIKLYHVQPPEWFVGGIGLVFVMTAVISSVMEKKLQEKHAKA